LQNIDHFIIIYQENWTFDGLYGLFPGANGLNNAGPTIRQVDRFGKPLKSLPKPSTNPPIPGGLPVMPFDLGKYIPPNQASDDAVHNFYRNQLQIDNGALEPSNGNMDKFVAWSDNGSLVMSYYDGTKLPEGQLALQYTLCDNFFLATYGGSEVEHFFMVAAAPIPWNQPLPKNGKFISRYDPRTKNLHDGALTFDGKYVTGYPMPAQAPRSENHPVDERLLPINDADPTKPCYVPTIGDRMDAAGVSWKWYSEAWAAALLGQQRDEWNSYWEPFSYFANYAPFLPDGHTLNRATTGPNAHLQDLNVLYADLANGTLPAVSWIVQSREETEHPHFALLQGQEHVVEIVQAVQNSTAWAHTAIIITYDDYGGRWDHVVPPKLDAWGDGQRTPCLIISPYAKRGFVDHTQYDTVSIVKTIEQRFQLLPLNARDANANGLANAFQTTLIEGLQRKSVDRQPDGPAGRARGSAASGLRPPTPTTVPRPSAPRR
jgi:phospholipase C